MKKLALILLLASFNTTAQENLNPVLKDYLNELRIKASKEDAGFTNFYADQGRELFFKTYQHTKKPTTRSCSTCHTKDPTNDGRTRAGKTIKPMMPVNENKRFSKTKKMNKWFRRNCKWTTGKICTAQQKGDFITYLINGEK